MLNLFCSNRKRDMVYDRVNIRLAGLKCLRRRCGVSWKVGQRCSVLHGFIGLCQGSANSCFCTSFFSDEEC